MFVGNTVFNVGHLFNVREIRVGSGKPRDTEKNGCQSIATNSQYLALDLTKSFLRVRPLT